MNNYEWERKGVQEENNWGQEEIIFYSYHQRWISQWISPLFIEQLIKNKRTSNKLKHDRNT